MKLGFVTESGFDHFVDPENPMIQYDNAQNEFYFPRPISIRLAPEWIAIILHTSGIGPVGVSHYK